MCAAPRRCLPFVPVLCALAAAVLAQDPADWWAYRDLQRPPVPAVQHTAWPRQPLDCFVLARLEAHGLSPAPEADRHTLLRRVTYDLTGLPPTEAEIAAFVDDPSPDAYEKVVERLLASPQYGVKWAQHWLDLVRYADTDGYERDRKKPFVWRYRDWVTDALNADMPYAQFVTKQLAGDELPEPTVADLVATGYYRLGIWDDEPTDPEQHRYDDLDGIADTTARAMLGIGMGCARCHDHKKDPLPQKDYHSFLAFFENVKPYDNQAHAVPVDGARSRFEAELAAFAEQRSDLVARLRRAAEASWNALDAGAKEQRLRAAEQAVVARYSGDRDSATRLIDDAHGQDGEVEGQVVAVEGHRGKAMRFDGDDDVVLPRLVQDAFSVSFFVRSDRPGEGSAKDTRWFTGTGLVDGEVPGVVPDWGISWHSDGRIAAGAGDPDTFLASGPGHDDAQWHHVAFTRERTTRRIALYVDGVLCGEARGSTKLLSAPKRLVVGRAQPGGRGFRGDLDELTFYSRALTAAEVASLAFDLPGGLAAAPSCEPQAMAELEQLHRPDLATVDVLAVQESGPSAPAAFVRVRGNVHAKGPQVEPGFPRMLGGVSTPVEVHATEASCGRRTALARWITDPGNKLTWRVFANRLWQHHFGRGIVRSSNDFGRLGELPTHPELLDWLACEVLAKGGSWKSMHRLLVTSATYRMASDAEPKALAADPQNDLFWRFDRRRLTAEEVRDSMFAVAGGLELELGGPSVFPPLPPAVLATASRPDEAWGEATPEQACRRSLYIHVKRSLQEPLLASFDRADTDGSCPVRFATVQPTQALILLNGEFAQQRAQALATRLAGRARDLRARLELGLQLVTQRPARGPDLERLLALAADLQRGFGRSEDEALQRCCLVLLNCNEFLFLD
ncbi:MAG TPA: DUF1553 domain-containing protein [Planctomycetota bacterium]|nr:DUF1553 domain-containing protein [Planctomycetota bacterium]